VSQSRTKNLEFFSAESHNNFLFLWFINLLHKLSPKLVEKIDSLSELGQTFGKTRKMTFVSEVSAASLWRQNLARIPDHDPERHPVRHLRRPELAEPAPEHLLALQELGRGLLEVVPPPVAAVAAVDLGPML
jgi:hypothetical protein